MASSWAFRVPRPSLRGAAFALVLLLTTACGHEATPPSPASSTATRPPGSASPTQRPSEPPPLASVRIRLVPVATLEQPLAMAVRPGDRSLYVAQKTGAVMRLRDGTVDPAPVLDLSGSVSLGSEQGLLGLAFSPDGRDLYVNYTDTNGHTHVTGYRWRDGRADPSSWRDVLVVEQPYSNHNGGNLAFGPDGYLYVGLGDGGSGGDPHGYAQSLSSLLGKMLRIDPRPSGGRPYSIPPDNPFVGRDGARPEIWAYGLRNPWRYSFDRATGDLWIGDVGQSEWEEIDRQRAGSNGGENYGWNRLEGDHPFEGDRPPDAVRPIYQYSHDEGGCTVTGGYVYRGRRIPGLAGAFLFGDFCLGRLEAIRIEGGEVRHRVLGPVVANLSSFGEDALGELYVLSLGGAVYRIAPAT